MDNFFTFSFTLYFSFTVFYSEVFKLKTHFVSHLSISGQNKLTGFINSILEFSKATEQWEIRRIFNDTLLAYTNETSDFPEGMHPWYFDSNCKDEGSPWRMLKIHRHVNLPGHFCCDDGHCIKSDLACDSVPHCKDNSDEDKTKCSNHLVLPLSNFSNLFPED